MKKDACKGLINHYKNIDLILNLITFQTAEQTKNRAKARF